MDRDGPTFQYVVSLFKACFQVSILDGSDWFIEGLGNDGFLLMETITTGIVSVSSICIPEQFRRFRSHLDGDNRCQLFILDLHSFGSSLSVKLSVSHHGTNDVTHTGHLQREYTHH